MSKHIVYKLIEPEHLPAPYRTFQIFEDEVYEVRAPQTFEKGGIRAIIPKPQIIVRNTTYPKEHNITNQYTGEFVSEHDDAREARKMVGRMNDIQQIMES